jgi:hypothetical protein
LLASVLIIVWLGAAGTAFLWGLEYYLLPLDDRVFSPLHALFGPTGVVGQGLGVIGTTLIVVGVVGYAARKRLGFLRRTGALKHWLQVHIFLCSRLGKAQASGDQEGGPHRDVGGDRQRRGSGCENRGNRA